MDTEQDCRLYADNNTADLVKFVVLDHYPEQIQSKILPYYVFAAPHSLSTFGCKP